MKPPVVTPSGPDSAELSLSEACARYPVGRRVVYTGASETSAADRPEVGTLGRVARVYLKGRALGSPCVVVAWDGHDGQYFEHTWLANVGLVDCDRKAP